MFSFDPKAVQRSTLFTSFGSETKIIPTYSIADDPVTHTILLPTVDTSSTKQRHPHQAWEEFLKHDVIHDHHKATINELLALFNYDPLYIDTSSARIDSKFLLQSFRKFIQVFTLTPEQCLDAQARVRVKRDESQRQELLVQHIRTTKQHPDQ